MPIGQASPYRRLTMVGISSAILRLVDRIQRAHDEIETLGAPVMKLILAITAAALMTAPGIAAPCKDAKGRFTKCPAAAASAAVTKDAKGKCHVASGPKKGAFTKCP